MKNRNKRFPIFAFIISYAIITAAFPHINKLTVTFQLFIIPIALISTMLAHFLDSLCEKADRLIADRHNKKSPKSRN